MRFSIRDNGMIGGQVASRPLGSRLRLGSLRLLPSTLSSPLPGRLRLFSTSWPALRTKAAAVDAAQAQTPRADLPKNFDVSREKEIYQWWESSGYFQPDESAPGDKYVISMPPPNVTGGYLVLQRVFQETWAASPRTAAPDPRPRRQAAHGPRHVCNPPGHHGSLSAHEGQEGPLGPGDGPRRHRNTGGCPSGSFGLPRPMSLS